jgi:SulP family sulfate permease
MITTFFQPKLLTCLKNYSLAQFRSDVIAGIIVGVIAVPLAIAFGIASGVTPERGLITAIIGGFFVSILGGSRVQIGGPTGAFIVIVYGIVQKYGLDGLLIATLMAGIILIIMGIAQLGSMIKFIPYPVIVGFTSGISVVIFSGQIRDFLGLQMENVPADFTDKWIEYIKYIHTINYQSVFISSLSLAVILLWPKISRKIPGSIVAILLTTFLTPVLHLNIETIGSRFGDIPSTFPLPALPVVDMETIRNLILPATTIAVLAAIEALLSAVVADGMIGGRHRSNTELIAQGAANILSPLFGGIPVTGAIARTATNVKNGGRTPIAGIVHAFVLLIIMLALGRWVKLIPMATLSAILIVVAYNMSEYRVFCQLLKSPRSDIAVLLTTFGLTVIFDLTIAIEIGMVLAVILFMRRMSIVTNVGVITRELKDQPDNDDPEPMKGKNVPDDVQIYEINGPFFFGAANTFKETMRRIEQAPRVRIIRMRSVPAIDATGLHLLKELYEGSKKIGTYLILSGVHTQPLFALTQFGLLDEIGEENIFGNIDDSLDRARELMNLPKQGRPKDFVPVVKREMSGD